MRVVIGVLVVLHLLGAAAIHRPVAGRAASPVGSGWRWSGAARARVVTGILLVGLHEMSSDPADELIRAKIGVKLVIAVACVALR
jgi:hypothetical protein